MKGKPQFCEKSQQRRLRDDIVAHCMCTPQVGSRLLRRWLAAMGAGENSELGLTYAYGPSSSASALTESFHQPVF